jgi:hypothetical protein
VRDRPTETLAVAGLEAAAALRGPEDSSRARAAPVLAACRGEERRRRAARARAKEGRWGRNGAGGPGAWGVSACRPTMQCRASPDLGAPGPRIGIAARSTSCPPSKADRDCGSAPCGPRLARRRIAARRNDDIGGQHACRCSIFVDGRCRLPRPPEALRLRTAPASSAGTCVRVRYRRERG